MTFYDELVNVAGRVMRDHATTSKNVRPVAKKESYISPG